MRPLIVISGPTAVGKTDCAIWLAEKLHGEIVSADSMQVYKYMDIGTAKPSLEQQQRVKHHLIDIVNPDRDFSVADYQVLFDRTVDSLLRSEKIPVVTGGTGLYIRACLRSYAFTDPGADPEIRRQLRDEAANAGDIDYLYRQLKQVDPETAVKIHPHDSHRLIRALEVYRRTGTPFSKLQAEQEQEQQQQKSPSKYPAIFLFLDRDRDELYQRIEARVDIMLQMGLVEEVKSLLEKGYSPELKAMQSLGYHQISQFLENRISLAEAKAQIKQKTRNYAKRQLTWFRKEPVDLWYHISGSNEEFFGEILNYIEGRLKQDVE
ncbi:MAG TPA: tRNA (adenosine(37)-N6)-dimethylallyltransferase MiaA [Firmicutes bacterium]|jgi:tRNA dimethylallyltransferase|nr:tRNA (adenosine(37)-N6)-dimethylallyltransferase MiaA [Bacillota bacterium]